MTPTASDVLEEASAGRLSLGRNLTSTATSPITQELK